MSASLVDDLDGLIPLVDQKQNIVQFLVNCVIIRIQPSAENKLLLILVGTRILLCHNAPRLISAPEGADSIFEKRTLSFLKICYAKNLDVLN